MAAVLASGGVLVSGGAQAAARTAGSPAAAGIIATAAGGIGGPGPARRVAVGPCGVMVAAGNLYVADQGAVRRISTGTDRLTTSAGVRVQGFSGDGGPATAAELNGACGMAVDHAGNLVLADGGNNRVRVVAARTGTSYGQPMTAGHIYTIVGNGTAGFAGDGGPAAKAELWNPTGVVADGAGNLVVTDSFNERVRVVAARSGTFYGQAMTAGDIYTVAGNGTAGFVGDGGRAAKAELWNPSATAVDGAGNLVIADTTNNRVRVVAARTGTFYGQKMTAGDIYTVAGDGTAGFFGDGTPATSAQLNQPTGIAVDRAGNLVIADSFNHIVRAVATRTGTFYGRAMTAGDIYTVAGNLNLGFGGDGRPARSATMGYPHAVAIDGDGNLVIADSYTDRVRVVAARSGTFYNQPMTAGDIYTVAGTGFSAYSGDRGPATAAELDNPSGTAVDGHGDLAIADTVNNAIRVVAATTGTFYGRPMRAGDIYTVAGNGTYGFTGDGGPGTKAELRNPLGVGVDGAGNLLVTDTLNYRIRVVAARSGTFYGRAMTAGDIYTVAGSGLFGFAGDGGPALKARLFQTSATTVDSAGNLVITDSGNGRVRVVAVRSGTFYGQQMTAGDIYTVAGNGIAGFAGDGKPATGAELDQPTGIVVDSAGNLVLSDTLNQRVRVVAARTGTFYGQQMTAADIYTVAGDGIAGFGGDGKPATMAELNEPLGMALSATGNLVVADMLNFRVRVISH